MPAEQFSVQAALMLLDRDDQEVPDEVEMLTRGVTAPSGTAQRAAGGSHAGATTAADGIGDTGGTGGAGDAGPSGALFSRGEEYITGHEAAVLPPDYSISERMVSDITISLFVV